MGDSLPCIETERLVLRLAQPADVEQIVSYYNHNAEHLGPWTPVRPASFFTEEFWLNQIEINRDEFQLDQSLKLFLFEKENGYLAGDVNFTAILRRSAQFCFVGYSLAQEKEGKGYMYEALKAAIDYVFTEMNLHRVMANFMPHNKRSARLLRRLGFRIEGYARDYLLISGVWQDHIMTCLINKNWVAPDS